MVEGLIENTNYAKDAILITIDGELCPLLKTTKKMVYYMRDDKIRRIHCDSEVIGEIKLF
jgi:hypothetical protein